MVEPRLEVDFADPAVNADPFPLFARLQAEDPVHWSEPMRAWILTRHDDVRRVALNNAELSADRLTPFFASGNAGDGFGALMTYLGHWMVFRDPPDHTRLRRLFTRAFTPRSVENLRPNIEAIVTLLLDRLEHKARDSGEADWIGDFAYPLPAMVIMDMLGTPRDDLAQVKLWSDEIALFIGTARASPDKYRRAEAGARAMADYFRGIVAARQAEPREDIVSRLVQARDEEETLNDDEVIATCVLLLFAGHETTTNLIGNGFYHSMRHRGEWERLLAEPALVEPAVEEWLRYDGPTGALARVVVCDLEFGGRTLRAGERIFAFLNAANRDPAQFEDPDRFDLGRRPNGHLTFGHGIHFCLGAPLARLEAQIALRQLLQRLPGIRLADETAMPDWQDSLILRGMPSLPVRLE